MILDPVPNPDISHDDVYIVDTTIPIENLSGGHPDDVRYFIFANDSIFKSNNDIKLQAGVDFQGKVGDTLVLLYDGMEWLEISRSLNPLYAGGSLNDYTLDSGYILNEINNIKNQIAIIQQELQVIGATTSDLTIIFNPAMTRADMQVLIDQVKPNIVYQSKVHFIFEDGGYTLDAPLEFNRFNGDGTIEISSINYPTFPTEIYNVNIDSHSSKVPVFKINNCDIDISIKGLNCYYGSLPNPSNNNFGGIVVMNSKYTDISYCNIRSDDEYGNDIYYSKSSGIITSTFTNKGAFGILATNMSRISITDCYANDTTKPQYGIGSLNGSEINLWDNHSPSGIIDNAYYENGGRIYS